MRGIFLKLQYRNYKIFNINIKTTQSFKTKSGQMIKGYSTSTTRAVLTQPVHYSLDYIFLHVKVTRVYHCMSEITQEPIKFSTTNFIAATKQIIMMKLFHKSSNLIRDESAGMSMTTITS